jgi:hypothetical protein
MQPRGGFSTSDVHVGSRRPNTVPVSEQSSRRGGFNSIDLSTMFLNQAESKVHMLRWNITNEFLDAKLSSIFTDEEALVNFIQEEVDALQRLRNEYFHCYLENPRKRSEVREVQSVVQIFLQGLLGKLRLIGIERTAAAANNAILDASFESNVIKDDERLACEISGAADMFILRGDIAAPIDLSTSTCNVETVVEIKPPFGALHQTSQRECMDQLTCEVEGLGQTLSHQPEVVKGLITDFFVISIHARVHLHKTDKVYHCISNRVVDAHQYIKHLMVICCSDITVDDMMISCINSPELIDLREGVLDGEPSDTNESNKDVEETDTKISGRNMQPRKRSCHSFREEEDAATQADNIQRLLDRDAHIRGLRVLRQIDVDTLSSR